MIDASDDGPPGWEAACDDVRLVQLVDLLCGIERQLALQLLAILYSDDDELEDEV